MLVRFTKNAPSAQADTLTCVRPDGTTTQGEMPRQGILPHDAFHLVVETTLSWHDAFFGQIAAGASPISLKAKLHAAKPPSAKTSPTLQSAALVECLEATQWGGAPDPAAFAKTLAAACRRRRVPPPDISAVDLARVRTALREFGAAWRPLNPGQSLERTFGALVPQQVRGKTGPAGNARTVDCFEKWRGRGRLPAGMSVDTYLQRARKAPGS